MAKLNKEEILEKIKERNRRLNLLVSIISILIMLTHPIYSIITGKGNYYVNIGVLVVSIIYGLFWLSLGSKKKYKINRIYKWSRLFLQAVALSINSYSIYITCTNFNFVSVVMSIAMGTFFVLNISFNVMYEIATYKFEKFKASKKEDIEELKNKINARKLKKGESND